MRLRLQSPIPLFDRTPVNPFVPIGVRAAITRSVGQGRPQAGARLALDGGEHGGGLPSVGASHGRTARDSGRAQSGDPGLHPQCADAAAPLAFRRARYSSPQAKGMTMNPLTIGRLHYIRGGYQGRLRALGIDATLCLVPVDPREGEDAPDWRIHLGDSEEGPLIGEARNRLGGPGGFHIAVLIDGPICPRPIHAWLVDSARHTDVHYLVWNRPPTPDAES